MRTPQIVVLLPDLPQDAAEHAALVDAALALARPHGAAVDIVQLGGAGPAPSTAPPSADGARSFCHARHAGAAGNDDPAALALLFGAALDQLDAEDHPDSTPPALRLCLAPPGPLGEELAATLAARQAAVCLGRCDAIVLDDGALLVQRQAFGGRIAASLRTTAPLCFATLRTQATPAAPGPAPVVVAGPTPALHTITLALALPAPPERMVLPSADALPRLEGARIVVSGGRGIGGAEGFALLAALAQQLGAALGGSLPTVDAGWVPVARQVGQSGKFVAPRVYLAVGISGTLQHLAGIAPQTAIFAVNNDPEAPIFQVAEIGVVADWQTLLPALLAALQHGVER